MRRRPAPDAIKVLVAVLPFQVHSARPLAHLETSIADELTKRLEASGKVDVVDTVVVREALIAHVAGERTDEVLRKLAREVGAEWVVQGSVTELAGSYSLDVRVAPAGERIPTRTMVFTANGDAELLERVGELVGSRDRDRVGRSRRRRAASRRCASRAPRRSTRRACAASCARSPAVPTTAPR